jgi:hypothetical protein
MDLNDILIFARAWNDLGNMITNQVLDLCRMHFGPPEEYDTDVCNANAIRLARDSLSKLLPEKAGEELAEVFETYFETLDREKGDA